MKNWQVIVYAFVGALFTGGIIFSITSTVTNDSPLSLVIIIGIMIIMFLLFIFLLLSYRNNRPSVEEMRDKE